MYNMKSYFLYDGKCGICSWSVSILLRISKPNSFYVSSLHSAFAEKLLDNFVEFNFSKDEGSVYISGNRIYYKSTAVLKVLADCEAPYAWAKYFLLIPVILRDFVYQIIAKNRSRISKKLNLPCSLPKNLDLSRLI